MELIQSGLLAFWLHFTTSTALQVFVVSTGILLIGLGVKVWSNAVHLTFLDATSLREIEFTHPHMPSVGIIGGMFIASSVLLIVSLQALQDIPPFDKPYQFIYLGALFVLSGAAGILGELKWYGAKAYSFSFIIGTSLAFLYLVFMHTIPQNQPLLAVLLFALLIACIALSWRVLIRSWTQNVQAVAVATFILWIVLYMLK